MIASSSQGSFPAPAVDGLVFNVSTLLMEPIGSTREYVLEQAVFTFAQRHVPVVGNVRFTRTDGSVMAAAALSLTIEDVCGRCLELFPLPLRIQFQEEFWPEFDPLTRERVEVPEGREGFPVIAGLLDLTEPVRQYVEMARPMQFRCREDCAGLSGDDGSPGSGANALPGDERWAALKDLRGELR